jgi:hypothetical protein
MGRFGEAEHRGSGHGAARGEGRGKWRHGKRARTGDKPTAADGIFEHRRSFLLHLSATLSAGILEAA